MTTASSKAVRVGHRLTVPNIVSNAACTRSSSEATTGVSRAAVASSVKRCTIIVERVMNQPGHSQPATVTLLVLG